MEGQISMKQIGIWMGSFLLVAVALVVIFKMVDSGASDGGVNVRGELPPVTAADWVIGTSTPEAVLVEYSDFECPACASYYPFVERLMDEYSDSIQFVYRHFPLPQHTQAKTSAYAAEAAGLQGKFFEMYRKLFENQSRWAGNRDADEIFRTYAEELGLDMAKYDVDVDSREIKNKVDLAYTSSVALGVNSTPTFFLDGEKILSPRSYDEFKALIDTAIGTNE